MVPSSANTHRDPESRRDVVHWDLRDKQIGPLKDVCTLPTKGCRCRKQQHCTVTSTNVGSTRARGRCQAPLGAVHKLLGSVRVWGDKGQEGKGMEQRCDIPEEVPAALRACKLSMCFGSFRLAASSMTLMQLSDQRLI